MNRPTQILLFTIVAATASSLYLEGGGRTLQGTLSSLNQGARNQAAALQQKLSPSSSTSKPVTDDRINEQLCQFWQQQDASHRRRQESLRRYCGSSGLH